MSRPNRNRRPKRSGSAAVDLVLNLAVTLSCAMALFWIAQRACGNLHDLIAAIVGLP